MTGAGQLLRVAEAERPRVVITIDGVVADALEGDTVLTALLVNGRRLRDSDFGDGPRAGFCLMGACQDCWVWQDEGPRLRACSAPITEGMRLRTTPSESWP